ncbi:hypothetical protein L6452_13013 [Arctium lappa]|uniref:Uncharacterized protein n=1 Tax=Arctium lappa TaxID=4217 RepID=A0ACB9CH11_ARCLA|nr:hypothetical protein L6452_13013 [Arctium lappa]
MKNTINFRDPVKTFIGWDGKIHLRIDRRKWSVPEGKRTAGLRRNRRFLVPTGSSVIRNCFCMFLEKWSKYRSWNHIGSGSGALT